LICSEKNGFDDEGNPIGGCILRSELNNHLALCEATLLECRATDAAADAYRSTIGSDFFFSTLQDVGGHSAHSYRSLTPHLESPEAGDQSFESFPSLSPLVDALPSVPPSDHSRWAKKERHRATLKAHLAFDHVELEVSHLYNFLNEEPLINSNFSGVMEEKLKQARQCFETISRSTPSLEGRRAKIKQCLVDLDDRIAELQPLIQAWDPTPIPYDTGVLLMLLKNLYLLILILCSGVYYTTNQLT
jgi:hypothetical protein